jgi:hypothetical protein
MRFLGYFKMDAYSGGGSWSSLCASFDFIQA